MSAERRGQPLVSFTSTTLWVSFLLLAVGCMHHELPALLPGAASVPLTDTSWRPVEIAGQPLTVTADQRAPHFVLVPAERQLRGFAGCNQFLGRYDVMENSLRFTGVAKTRKYCEGTMDQEQEFLHALEATASHKMAGEALDLYDANGKLLARFKSGSLK